MRIGFQLEKDMATMDFLGVITVSILVLVGTPFLRQGYLENKNKANQQTYPHMIAAF